MTTTISALGGYGEIGKNMTVIAHGRDAIVLDAGMIFPGADEPGVACIVPDMRYVADLTIHGVLLTHGHEDHIGGLPHLLRTIHPQKPRLMGTELTLRFASRRIEEQGLHATNAVIIPGTPINLGPFRAWPFAQNHSIPQAVGFVIDTPDGRIVFTGDYKLWPGGRDARQWRVLRELCKDGVDLMIGDSTNALEEGFAKSERDVEPELRAIFRQAKGQRIIASTFASSLFRIETLLRLAREFGRKVTFFGRSMQKAFEVMESLGIVQPDLTKNVINIADAERVAPEELLVLTTGSQGEPLSGLWRLSHGTERALTISPGDVVIIAATPIPGNERLVSRIIDDLMRRGADVYYGERIHASGHGNTEDLRTMLQVVRPRWLIPTHGEYRMLLRHARIAQEERVKTLIVENGQQAELDKGELRLGKEIPAGEVLLEDDGEIVPYAVVRDRLRLQEDGVLVIAYAYDERLRIIRPRIRMRGVLDYRNHLDELRRIEQALQVMSATEELTGSRHLDAFVEEYVAREIKRRLGVTPLIVAMGVPVTTREPATV